MKNFEEFINEQLILEYLIGFCKEYNVAVNLSSHAEERETRHDKDYISKIEILSSICKVIKQIKEDINNNIIHINDNILIEDKSKNITTNFICSILNDTKNKNEIKINVITNIRKKNFIEYNITKKYVTYINDKEVQKKIKLLNNVGI